jgi:ketol-acid reductoisomerase
MDKFNVNFRLKKPDIKWEHSEQTHYVVRAIDMDEARTKCDIIAQLLADINQTQVRWEYTEIGQGHYISPHNL